MINKQPFIMYSDFLTYQKFSPIKFSIELAAAIRTLLSFKIVALSMPRSSERSISKKSPTECVIGLSVNWHNSFRLGSGTVTCGNPYTYLTVTEMREREKNGNERIFDKNNLIMQLK